MRLKLVTAIAVLSLIVAFVMVSGCATNTSNPTPSAAPTHNAFLENFLTGVKNLTYSDPSSNVTAWKLEWLNDTAAHLQYDIHFNTGNLTMAFSETFLVFPTSQDATNYMNAFNKTGYTFVSNVEAPVRPGGGTYKIITGHAPKIYSKYVHTEGSLYGVSGYTLRQLERADNLIVTTTATTTNPSLVP